MLPMVKYTENRWQLRVHQHPSCVDCKPVEPTFQCKVCKRELPETEFEDSQWQHRLKRDATCHSCRHPKCTNACCRTCPRCHN
eukprot:2949293-Karenia_brevis.AAC.1